MLKLFGLAPCANALQAEYVVAVGKDAETLFPARLLHDRVKADAARLVLGSGDGEGQLHGLFVLLEALAVVILALGLIRWM